MIQRRRRRTTRTATTTRRRRSAAPRRRRRRNPISAVRRAANPVRHRRRNSTRIVIRRNRRRNPGRARRNPNLFGSRVSNMQMTQAVLGGLVGVTAAKLIPAALPPNLTATPIMKILSTAGASMVAGWVGSRISEPFGSAVLFGGLMQTGSILLNAFIPAIGGQIGLSGVARSGLGELVAGSFVVPQNPLNPGQANYPMAMALPAADGSYGANAPVTMNGLARAFPKAF